MNRRNPSFGGSISSARAVGASRHIVSARSIIVAISLRASWRGFPICRVMSRSEEHTSELQSLTNLVCRLLLEKKKQQRNPTTKQNTDITNQTHHTQSRHNSHSVIVLPTCSTRIPTTTHTTPKTIRITVDVSTS